MTVFFAGCDNHDVNDAVTEVARFHSMYNTKEFNGIYDAMLTNEFRNSMPKSSYVKFMSQIYNIIGAYDGSTLKKAIKLNH